MQSCMASNLNHSLYNLKMNELNPSAFYKIWDLKAFSLKHSKFRMFLIINEQSPKFQET